ncbi:nucleoside triphosphate pyrophosphohydrolase [Marinicella sp. W31]|uniref:nucleoside triphosphate pyrophosphohydrolase n=1 Tax=Marinicella sp. W31 TaxID=3023713 RepID=UPI00375702C9
MSETQTIDALLDMMARLRDPENGCPWDVKQSFATIAPYTIEEAYEVSDAIERGNMQDLKMELGDLLFQVVFHARMAEEAGHFNFFDVAQAVTDKMISRHPHVFDPEHPKLSADEQNAVWEKNKNADKDSVLDDIPNNMPELLRAVKLTKSAATIGFDWPEIDSVLDKMLEELQEFKEAIAGGNADEIKDELGDLLFVCANIARHVKVDPGAALRHANHKFESRFRQVEKYAKNQQSDVDTYDLDVLENYWNQVKAEG